MKSMQPNYSTIGHTHEPQGRYSAPGGVKTLIGAITTMYVVSIVLHYASYVQLMKLCGSIFVYVEQVLLCRNGYVGVMA
jgi:hypothetical protein